MDCKLIVAVLLGKQPFAVLKTAHSSSLRACHHVKPMQPKKG